jgi:hypothetical protein
LFATKDWITLGLLDVRSSGVLVLDEPHQPACRDRAADEQEKTERSESDHHSWLSALRDAEHD